MENSMRLLMTVFAVSGSMVLVFHQANKHLFNSFMRKFEYEIRGSIMKHHQKKKVRFAKDVVELQMEDERDRINLAREQHVIEKILVTDDAKNWKHEEILNDIMPPNRVALYKGIMNDRKGRI